MDIETEPPLVQETSEEEIEIDIDDAKSDVTVEEKRPLSRNEKVGKHGFFIQDILSPDFGNQSEKSVQEQYLAYLHYCYTLQMQNMLLLHGSVRNGLSLDFTPKLNLSTQINRQSNALPDGKIVNYEKPVAPFYRQQHNTSPSIANPKKNNVAFVLPFKSKLFGFNEEQKRKLERNKLCENNNQINLLAKDCHEKTVLADQYRDQSKTRSTNCDVININTQDSTVSARTEQPDENDCDVTRNCQFPNEDSVSSQGSESTCGTSSQSLENKGLWPAWVYCTRYSDRPSSGPRSRKIRRKDSTSPGLGSSSSVSSHSGGGGGRGGSEKRPRIAFTNEQLSRLKREFDESRYLTEERRAKLAQELDLTDAQVKIWFQNKRAKLKKTSGLRNPLALSLMAQGLYNHAPNSKIE